MSIRGKLTTAFVAVLCIALFSVGGFFFTQARETIRRLTYSRLQSVAVVEKQLIQRIIEENFRILAAMTSRYQLRRSMHSYLNGDRDRKHKETIKRILDEALKNDRLLFSLSVAEPGGEMIVSTNDELEGLDAARYEIFEVAKKSPSIEVFNIEGGRNVGLRLMGPCYYDDEFIGVFILEMSGDSLKIPIHEEASLGETGEVVIGRRLESGDALFLFPLRFEPDAALRLTIPAENMRIPINKALNKERGLYLDLPDYRGVDVLAVTEYIPQVNWGIVVKIDKAEAFRPIRDLQRVFFVGSIVSLTLAILISILISASITRPLKRLTIAAQKIIDGEKEDLPLSDGRDEVGVMSSSLQRMVAKVNEHSRLLRTVIDLAPALISVKDESGSYCLANQKMAEMYAETPESILGKKQKALHPDHEELKSFQEYDLRTFRNGGDTEMVHEPFTDVSGVVHKLNTRKVPFIYEDKPAVLGVSLDVTDQVEAESAAVAATAASEAKSRFLANMSHEIRTPMNAVIGFTELLLETSLNDVQNRYVNTIHRSAKSLLELIDDILDLSKLESGKLELEQAVFNLPDVIREAVNIFNLPAGKKGLELRLTFQSGMPSFYKGDPIRVRQIVINLVGNAVKFTHKGGVDVWAGVSGMNGLIRISVIDTGIGMTPEELESIFDPFTQADVSTARRFGGTGLGVSICKQLAEAMGGRIWATSRPDAGSAFHVTLQLTEISGEDYEAFPNREPIEKIESSRRFKVLVVDDIHINTELVGIHLERRSHIAVVAYNGYEALDAFSKQSFDIIFMDVHMPEMDGLEATRRIRELEREKGLKKTPIVAMTASVMKIDQELCIEAGMDEVLKKPIDFAELFQLMERLIPDGCGVPIDLGPIGKEDRRNDLAGLAGIDAEDGLARWGDAEKYAAALINFAENFCDAPERLERFLEMDDIESARQLSHALKGAAGNLSVSRTAQLASRFHISLTKKFRDGFEALLKDLKFSLDESIASINSLRTEFIESVELDPQKAAESLAELVSALETDSPEGVESAYSNAAACIPHAQLIEIRFLIKNYRFDEASSAVRALLNSLSPM